AAHHRRAAHQRRCGHRDRDLPRRPVPAARSARTAPGMTRGLVVRGLLAVLIAMVATTLVAALARALGVDFEIPDGEETIPVSGVAVITGVLSLVGVLLAVALRRWIAHPAKRFVWIAVALTAISLVPPVISGGDAATIVALLVLHLVAAAVMIPTLARG